VRDAAISIFLTIAAGLVFYWLRCQRRFLYGLCEIFVAFGIMYMTFVPQTNYFLMSGPSSSQYLLTKGAGILGGIYIFVRGMDNMDKDLPPKWRRIWDTMFSRRIR
jgi:hypothetical protein